jgi:phosphatidylglycerol---prolipoprotein diacylglyceryl transferase
VSADPVNIDNWGIRPVLFTIGNIEVSSYSFFVALGFFAGVGVYIYEAKRKKDTSEKTLYIAIGSIAGGILGAKLLDWIINIDFIFKNISSIDFLISGRTIIGGLIGGYIGANLAKKYTGIKSRKGNLFAPGIALGVAIGRIGCFLSGCCYGKECNLPWGVDFGDKISRHPTQLYESIFMLGMFIWLQFIKNKKTLQPGQLFTNLMLAYFSFRFFIEFIRDEKIALIGFTYFQFICIFVILFLLKDKLIKPNKKILEIENSQGKPAKY